MNNIPSEYKPISAWGYFGYELLFCLPIIGFIFLLVFAFNNSNINRRNFARSYFCVFLIVIVIWVILLVLGFSLSEVTNGINPQ